MRRPVRQALCFALLLAGLAWYGMFRVAAPIRHEPFSAGFNGNDFKHIYIGASMFLEGRNPYDGAALLSLVRARGMGAANPYVYPPFTALVLSPLTALSPPDAMRAWFWINHLLLAGSLVLMFFSVGLRRDLFSIAVAVCLAALFFPLHRTLTAGQLNCALLFLLSLVYALERRRWFVAAGLLASVAFLFKLIPGILLPYFIWQAIARREDRVGYLRATGAMVGGTALLLAASILAVGWEPHRLFLGVLGEMSYGRSTWAEFGQHFYRDPANQSLNSFLHHAFAAYDGTRPWISLGPAWANALTWVATALCGLVVLAVEVRNRIFRCLEDNGATFAAFVLLALLIPSIYWDHYAVIALWALLWYFSRLERTAQAFAFACFLLWVLPLGSFLEIEPHWALLGAGVGLGVAASGMKLQGSEGVRSAAWGLAAAALGARFIYDLPPFRHGPGLMIMSIKLWATIMLLGLCLFMTRPHCSARRT